MATTEVNAPRIVTKEPFMLTRQPGDQGDATLPPKRKSLGRRKIEIKYIANKEKRGVTLSKRKGGLLKKGAELAALCGAEVLQVVITQNFKVYVQTTQAFRHLVPQFDMLGDPITTAFHAYKRDKIATGSAPAKEPTAAKLDVFNGSDFRSQSSFSASSSSAVATGAAAAVTTTTIASSKKKVSTRRDHYRRQRHSDDDDGEEEGEDTIDQMLRGSHIKPIIKHRDSSMENGILYVPHVAYDRRENHIERQIEDTDHLPIHLMGTRFGEF